MQPLSNKDTEDSGDDSGVVYRTRSKWRIIGFVILTILLILCIAFIVLYAVEKNARKEAEDRAAKLEEKEKICSSKNCLYSAYGKQPSS